MAKIFITEEEYKADIKVSKVAVYKAKMKYWVTDKEHKSKKNDAKWFFVDRENKADKVLCWVREHKADLKVAEVSQEYKAKGSF